MSDISQLGDFLDNPPPILPELIGDGVLLPQSRCIVFGRGGVGKSIIVENMAYALAGGTDWCGHSIVNPVCTLYIQSEVSPQEMHKRTRMMEEYYNLRGRGLDHNLHLGRLFNIKVDEKDGYERLATYIEANKIEVLVIDPFYKFSQASEDSNSQLRDFTNFMDEAYIEQLGISIILVHHSRQPQTVDGMQRDYGISEARGGSVLVDAWADTAFQLRERKGEHVLKNEKMRNGVQLDPRNLRADWRYYIFVPSTEEAEGSTRIRQWLHTFQR